MVGKRIRAAAAAAAEKGARDEVRRQLQPAVDRLVILIDSMEERGLEAGAKGPGGFGLGSVWLRIPATKPELAFTEDDKINLLDAARALAQSTGDEDWEEAVRTIREILDDTQEIKPIQ